SLRSQVALVTGASSGLGRHFAKTLAAHGAKVIVAARRVEKLQELVTELQSQGVASADLCAVRMDVQDVESIQAALTKARTITKQQALGPIAILVNNAGVAVDKPALRQTLDDWRRVIDTNLTGPWLVAQAVARGMVKNKSGGSIINISSVAGLGPSPYMPGYAASKAGLVHLTRVLALEWARYGIRVNSIAPGYIVTDMNRDFFESDQAQRVIAKIPQRRTGAPEDLDGILLLMASEAGGFMTGSIVNVDGGHLVSNL
ncbi:2,3-dihydro-2,3-dihydroxybenzoate dehydrogenase, partial [Tribonema minus]